MVVAGASRRDGSVVVSLPSLGTSCSQTGGPGVRMTGTSTVGTVAAGVSSEASGRVRASIVGGGTHGTRGADGAVGRLPGIAAVGAECSGIRTSAPRPGPGDSRSVW